MNREQVEQIAKEQKDTFIKISRVPINTKILFKQISEEEFAGDFGMMLQWSLQQALEYQRVKDCLLDKEFISHLLQVKEQKETTVSRKTFGDKLEELKGGKNERYRKS